MDAELWGKLPEELFPPILARLPWWSNLELRGVCKSWNAKLSKPEYFLRSKSMPSSPPQALCCLLSPGILSTAGNCAVVNLLARKNWNALPRPSSLPSFDASDFFELEAATSGLLLMEGRLIEKGRILINPLNKTHRRIPPVPPLVSCCSEGYVARSAIKEHTQGMVLDDATHNVRIVALQHQTIDGHVTTAAHSQQQSFLSDLVLWRIHIYDLGRNTWDLVSSVQSEHLQRIKSAILVGNLIYILTKQPNSRHRHRHRVFKALGNDLIEVPAEITIDIPTVHLFQHRGSLMLVSGTVQQRASSVDIWRLDHQATDEKWVKVVSMPESLVDSGWARRDFDIDVEGDFVSFTSYAKKEVILVLNLVKREWESVTCTNHVLLQDWASIRTFLWQPRLDIVL